MRLRLDINQVGAGAAKHSIEQPRTRRPDCYVLRGKSSDLLCCREELWLDYVETELLEPNDELCQSSSG
jgi:hypothetical protein